MNSSQKVPRMSSAPPDEGEPHLKVSILELNSSASEFMPSYASLRSHQTQYPPKKQLRADASVYQPVVFNPNSPSFELSGSAAEFVPSFLPEVKPSLIFVSENSGSNNASSNRDGKTMRNESVITHHKETSGVAGSQKAEVKEINPETATDQNIAEAEKKIMDAECIEERLAETEKNLKDREEIKIETDIINQGYVKKVFTLNEIKSLKLDFVRDPNFLAVPTEILRLKERRVEVIKIPPRGKKPEEGKRITREPQVILTVQWRKARTAEEEKISTKAKVYLQKFSIPPSEQEKIKKQIKITLNKLSPNNFDKLSNNILETCKSSHDYLKLVVSGIFEKAWSEKKYTQMYSNLCKFLKNNFEKFSYGSQENTGQKNFFKHELLHICEETFKDIPGENKFTDLTHEGREERLQKIKNKTLGNVRFIGELFNVNLITAKVILECVNSLLDVFEKENNDDKLEGACVLLQTGGASFERSKLKVFTDEIFKRLEEITKKYMLSSKSKFKIIDLQEHRAADWKTLKKEEVKTKEEIHADFHGYNN